MFLDEKMDSSSQNDDNPPSRPRSAKRKIKYLEASDSGDDRDENWCPANSDSNSESGYTSYQKKIKRLKDRNALSRFRTKESLRQKERWRSMSAEKRAAHNAKAKIRMQRTRDKRKKLLEEKKRLRSNAKEIEEQIDQQREEWRRRKRAERARKKVEVAGDNSNGKSASTKRKARQRVRDKMPEDPEKWLERVKEIVESATPKKRELLRASGMLNTPKSKQKIIDQELVTKSVRSISEDLKHKRDDKSRRARLVCINICRRSKKVLASQKSSHRRVSRQLVKKSIRASLGLRWSKKLRTVEQTDREEIDIGRKVRKDVLSPAIVQSIENFVQGYDVSTPLASVKMVKDGKPPLALNQSLKKTHAMFVEKTGIKIGLTSFKKYRPKHVLTITKARLYTCRCEKCTNAEQMMTSIIRFAQSVGVKSLDKLNTATALRDITVCPHTSFPDLNCTKRLCQECGTRKLQDALNVLKKYGQKTVIWRKWKGVWIPKNESKETKESKESGKKESKESEKKPIKPSSKTHSYKKRYQKQDGRLNDLTKMLVEECESLSDHLFIAHWQAWQYKQLKANLPEGYILMVLDFAENFRTHYQFEVQSAHWAYEQVTIHPIVVTYTCPTCEKTVTENIVVISQDLNHDADSVGQYVQGAYKYLTEYRHVQQVKKIVQFSDGCASQYKSHQPFFDISKETLGPTERCFFGSGHGKGPADGVGSVVKQAAYNAIKGGVVIEDAKDLYTFCRDELTVGAENDCLHPTKPEARTFLYMEKTQPDDKRPSSFTVKGTREVHSVNSAGEEGVVRMRYLSCHCAGCQQETKCEYSEWVDEWKTVSVLQKNSSVKRPRKVVKKSQGKQCPPDKTSASKHETLSAGQHKSDSSVPYDVKFDERPATRSAVRRLEMPQCSVLLKKMKTEKPKSDSSVHKDVKLDERPASRNAVRQLDMSHSSYPSKKMKTNVPVVQTAFSLLNRRLFFDRLFSRMQSCKNYVDLTILCESIVNPHQISLSDINIYEQLSEEDLDRYSNRILPCDIPNHPLLFAKKIYGDGNCLARCGSMLAFGTEEHFVELKVRMIVELVQNEQLYLDNDYLKVGHHDRSNYAKNFAMCSPQVGRETLVDDSDIRLVFQREVFEYRKPGVYAGMWQLFALSNVLKTNLFSAYPMGYGYNVRGDYHRMIIPHTDSSSIVYIMWTSLGGELDPKKWSPNHFITLLDVNPNRPR